MRCCATLRSAATAFDARYTGNERGLDCAPIRGEDPSAEISGVLSPYPEAVTLAVRNRVAISMKARSGDGTWRLPG
jgi:hypothetical protein